MKPDTKDHWIQILQVPDVVGFNRSESTVKTLGKAVMEPQDPKDISPQLLVQSGAQPLRQQEKPLRFRMIKSRDWHNTY